MGTIMAASDPKFQRVFQREVERMLLGKRERERERETKGR
jgi:hypothetical protein